jgi:ornithine carbamoyltransferase
MDWHCTPELMAKTANGMGTIYMHPLPADIEGVSCEHGEVANEVFDAHRDGLYKEASYKPYAVAAMIFLQKAKDPVTMLKELEQRGRSRWLEA